MTCKKGKKTFNVPRMRSPGNMVGFMLRVFTKLNVNSCVAMTADRSTDTANDSVPISVIVLYIPLVTT